LTPPPIRPKPATTAAHPPARALHPPAPRRAQCATCLRAASACICDLVAPTQHRTEVLILQHPMEVQHAKNTGRLLHLSLRRSQLLVGETISQAQLLAACAPGNYAVLLYPESAPKPVRRVGRALSEPVSNLSLEPTPLDVQRLQVASRITLVVLDATWRKSRKMLHLSPALQALPRLALRDVPASGYTIRKAHKAGQRSTLEATCAALAQLEGNAVSTVALLEAFGLLVARLEEYAAQ
jgi:DTW domain-containing protein YfiP